jgi:hypothetical protein
MYPLPLQTSQTIFHLLMIAHRLPEMPHAAGQVQSSSRRIPLFVLLAQLAPDKAELDEFFFGLPKILFRIVLDVFRDAKAPATLPQQQIDSRRLLDFVTHSHPQNEKDKVEECHEDVSLRFKRTKGRRCKFRVLISSSFIQTYQQVLFQALVKKELLLDRIS